ncbi:MAG: ACP S-malonyltransferase [Comamonas sp.]|nr:ACP S-malonyltransferase [Comamonas sp.]
MKNFAFVFPGQGSQSVGMLDAWGDHPAVRQAVQEASDALGEDLGALIASGTKEALGLTTNTQPVMLLAGVAAWRVWQAEGGTISGATPAAVAGHSLGEYSALVAAGVLTLSQAAPLVRLRAAAMQEAVPVGAGAMAAVLGLNAEAVKTVCAQVTAELGGAEVVEAVNFNDPGQTVIAGSKAAVEAAGAAMKAAGAKRALPLPVSAPFHSSLMRPAAEKLKQALAAVELATPSIPVINNIDVAVATAPDAIRDALYRQAFGAVRWVETVQAMKARGITHLIECGPGKVLTGMTKRIDPELLGAALYDPATLSEVKELLA